MFMCAHRAQRGDAHKKIGERYSAICSMLMLAEQELLARPRTATRRAPTAILAEAPAVGNVVPQGGVYAIQ